jgi:hypothetical protein
MARLSRTNRSASCSSATAMSASGGSASRACVTVSSPSARAAWVAVDRYANGAGCVSGRLFGRYELFRQADEHVHRSAAARAALEAVFAPASLLPGRGVSWRAEDEERIVASSDLEPEHIEVHMQIGSSGALRSISAERWGNIGKHSHGYLSFGGDVHAEQRFGDCVIPSRLTVGWGYGSEDYKPFFEAPIHALQLDQSRR